VIGTAAPIAGLLEVLQRRAAGRRNAPAVSNQAMGDAFAIGNELPANDLGVLHARLLIRLRIGLGGERRQAKTKTKHGQRESGANFHETPRALPPLFVYREQRFEFEPRSNESDLTIIRLRHNV
jgi:hypothetical protein